MILLGLLALIGLTLAIHRATRVSLAVAPPIDVSLVIIVLYLCALLGALWLGAMLLLLLGLSWSAWQLIRVRRDQWTSPLLQPQLLLLIIFSLLLYWPLQHATFVFWDDFGHWGLGSREMFFRHQLPDNSSILFLKDYPPGSWLFHYFILRLAEPTEGNIITAHSWLLIWPLAPIFFQLQWRHLFLGIAPVAGAYLFITVLGPGLQTALVDHVLSVFFASSLMAYFCLRIEDRNPIWIAPVLISLPLIKDAGVLLSGIAIAVIALDFVLFQRELGRPIWRRATVAGLIFLVVTPVAAMASWRWHVHASDLRASYPIEGVTLDQLLDEWSSERARAIRRIFFTAVPEQPLSQFNSSKQILVNRLISDTAPAVRPFTSVDWVVVLAALLAFPLVFGTFNISRTRILALIVACGVGFAAYAMWLLAMYIVFLGDEGLKLTSFARYLGTYPAGIGLFAIFLLQGVASKRGMQRGWPLIPAVGLLFLGQTPSLAILHDRLPLDPIRTQLKKLVDDVRAAVPPDKKVHMIYQNSNGAEVVRLRFELAPRPSNRLVYSIGEPYFAGDIWTRNISREELVRVLGPGPRPDLGGYEVGVLTGVDYLLLARVDDQFWRRYGSLFAPADRYSDAYLFRVDSNLAGNVTLTPVLRKVDRSKS